MARQTRIVNFSLPPEVFAEVEKVAKEGGKSRSEILREALKQYLASNRRWREIRRWGEETARKFGIKDERDVERIIDEYREAREKEIHSG